MTIGDFSEQAADYENARPGYPGSLVDALVAEARIQCGDAVADFGAGTGIFTRMLIERRLEVKAIEPNDEMIRRADLPASLLVKGTFEHSLLADQSQAWAVAAQAFHWAVPERALPEVRRILKPGGLLSVLWNNRANEGSEVLQWTADAIRRYVPDFDEAYRNRPWDKILESTGDFSFQSRRTVRHTVTMSKQRYLALWRSHNRLNNIAGRDRFASFYGELTDYLERQRIARIDVPYACEAWSARRRD